LPLSFIVAALLSEEDACDIWRAVGGTGSVLGSGIEPLQAGQDTTDNVTSLPSDNVRTGLPSDRIIVASRLPEGTVVVQLPGQTTYVLGVSGPPPVLAGQHVVKEQPLQASYIPRREPPPREPPADRPPFDPHEYFGMRASLGEHRFQLPFGGREEHEEPFYDA